MTQKNAHNEQADAQKVITKPHIFCVKLNQIHYKPVSKQNNMPIMMRLYKHIYANYDQD